MPSTTVQRHISLEEVTEALKSHFGDNYAITPRRTASEEAVRLHRGAAFATVYLEQEETSTTLRVHDGGLIISRLFNEFGIARRVNEALGDAFRADSAG
jgi:hypothetical protein